MQVDNLGDEIFFVSTGIRTFSLLARIIWHWAQPSLRYSHLSDQAPCFKQVASILMRTL